MCELAPVYLERESSMAQDLPQLSWFIKYRRIAVITQVVLFCYLLFLTNNKLALWGFGITALLSAVTSVFVELKLKSFTFFNLGVLLILDTALLTALLYFSGGANNPFSIFFISQVALAAILISEKWSWILALLSTICYGLLFFFSIDLPVLSSHGGHGHHSFSIHLQGMWVAFAILAATQAFFFTRIVRALRERESELRQLASRAEKSERLASVTALAANAAHELNTPLSSIKLTAGEIVERLKKIPASDEIRDDAALILSEVTRCSAILNRLRQEAGDLEGQVAEELPFELLGEELKMRFVGNDSDRINIDSLALDLSILVPKKPFLEAATALVKNALESSANAIVKISAKREKGKQEIRIQDNGPGMTKDILSRIGEPFFTTKDGGRGLGLGFFLAKSFIEKLGGSMSLESEPGFGTSITMMIPVRND